MRKKAIIKITIFLIFCSMEFKSRALEDSTFCWILEMIFVEVVLMFLIF